ncbi:twin-arginine translocation signal domain-containing protein [Streptomyces sp. NRRL F-4474]|nr:twin-arginine translocation signal domain-containing protein [Streptomyces sp. NRRL F-4474]
MPHLDRRGFLAASAVAAGAGTAFRHKLPVAP